jgi:HK97 gp10 family phage protein
MFEVQINTPRKTEEMLRKMPDEFRAALLDAMKIIAPAIERIVKKSFGTEGKPGVRSGHLRRSIYSKAYERASNVIGVVGTEVIYGRFLEDGTKKMKAKPFLRPAITENQEKIDLKLQEIVARRMNK